MAAGEGTGWAAGEGTGQASGEGLVSYLSAGTWDSPWGAAGEGTGWAAGEGTGQAAGEGTGRAGGEGTGWAAGEDIGGAAEKGVEDAFGWVLGDFLAGLASIWGAGTWALVKSRGAVQACPGRTSEDCSVTPILHDSTILHNCWSQLLRGQPI